MASFSPSPNSPPVNVPPLPPLTPASTPPTSSPPSQTPPPVQSSTPPSLSAPPPSSRPSSPPQQSTDSSPPSQPPVDSPPPTAPPPSPAPPSPPPPATTVPPPSNPPVSSSPPVSPRPPAESPPQSSPSSPSNSPPASPPDPPSRSPPPSPLNPPPRSPPPSPPNPPTRSPPDPPTRSPPPSPPNPPTRSPPIPPAPPPPPPPSPNPPASSTPAPSDSPLVSPPPPSEPPRNTPATPPPRHSRSPPSSSPPPPLVSPTRSPPPSTVSPPPVPSPPPSTPSTNSSSPPGIEAFPPFRPSPPQVLVSPPGNTDNNDSSPNTQGNDEGISTAAVVGIAVALGFVLLAVIIGAAWCVIKRKKKGAGSNGPVMPTSMPTSPSSDLGLLKIQISAAQTGDHPASDFAYTPREPGGLGNSRSMFSYEDLAKATNGFSVQNFIGSGGFGSVYKGYLDDGTEVAVKELNIGGGQGEREFSAEVEIIGRIHHRHLVSLVGYCISENKRLLVYEYVPNNTLYFHLHVSKLVLDWATRVKVASGAARGIAYLHEDCHPRIIHRDIKSSNILLDKNFEARVADFGLAKLAADAYTHVTTRVMGTFGYMAPEYASSGKLTEKSDVFSFGVVLLELITGRKPVDASQPLGEESVVEWARPLLSHALETEEFEALVDPRLETNFVASEMFRMIEAAAACVRHSAVKRPRMGQILRAFDSMETEDLTNGMRVGESEIYNSAQQSAEIRMFRRMAFGSQSSTDLYTQGSNNER